MFSELLASAGVSEVYVPGSEHGVMALHGGLEAGTFEIAAELAEATGASLYAVVQPDDLRWHVPSIRFDPAESVALAQFIRSVAFAVSIHGFGRQHLSGTALLGGGNAVAARQLADRFTAHGLTAISDPEAIPKSLRGRHRRNPVNLPRHGGVQVELTPDLRQAPARHQVAAALVAALTDRPLGAALSPPHRVAAD